MPNVATLLKSEITRIARKELRPEITSLRKTVAHQRSEIASLKRRVNELEGLVRRISKARPAAQPVDADDVRLRFSAKGLANHRKKLGLSAEAYGRLIGASGQTVYKWEEAKTHPRARQLEGIAAVRGMGKREALRKLEELAANAPPARVARKAPAKTSNSRRAARA